MCNSDFDGDIPLHLMRDTRKYKFIQIGRHYNFYKDGYVAIQPFTEIKVVDNYENNTKIILELEDGAFDNLSFIEKINLSYRKLKISPNFKFSRCLSNLNELNLRNTELSSSHLGFRLFSLLYNLKILDLSGNHFYYLNNNSFYGLKKLEILKLENCGPLNCNYNMRIHNNTFKVLINLRELDLTSCNIKSINPDIFKFNQKLIKLTLKYNYNLKKFDFNYLSNLEYLNLQHVFGYISCDHGEADYDGRFENSNFSSLTNLKILDLRHNLLKFFDPFKFSQNVNLECVYINHNNSCSSNCEEFRGTSFYKDCKIGYTFVRRKSDFEKILKTEKHIVYGRCKILNFIKHPNKYASIPTCLKECDFYNIVDVTFCNESKFLQLIPKYEKLRAIFIKLYLDCIFIKTTKYDRFPLEMYYEILKYLFDYY